MFWNAKSKIVPCGVVAWTKRRELGAWELPSPVSDEILQRYADVPPLSRSGFKEIIGGAQKCTQLLPARCPGASETGIIGGWG